MLCFVLSINRELFHWLFLYIPQTYTDQGEYLTRRGYEFRGQLDPSFPTSCFFLLAVVWGHYNCKVAATEIPLLRERKIIIFCSSNFTVASPPSTPRGDLYYILFAGCVSSLIKMKYSDPVSLRIAEVSCQRRYRSAIFPAKELWWFLS